MSKRKKWKIGTQRQPRGRAFPVVMARMRPFSASADERCVVPDCKSLEFMDAPPRAQFLFQPSVEQSDLFPLPGFSNQQQSRLLWEKSYRQQKAGQEPPDTAFPLCSQCSAFTLMQHLGDNDEQRATMAIAAAITRGKDLILFDGNFSSDRTYPAVAVGTFETLALFREHFWREMEEQDA